MTKTVRKFIFILTFVILVVVIREENPVKNILSTWPFFSKIIAERTRVKIQADAQTLGYAQPSFDNLVQALDGRRELDPTDLEIYRRYYERAADLFPGIAEIHNLLGFCYYLAGEEDKAVRSYQTALKLNPVIFWFSYNLGLMYLNRNDYPSAAKALKMAAASDPDQTIASVYSSRVYQQIFWPKNNLGGYPVKASLKEGYDQAQGLLIQMKSDVLKTQDIRPKIF